MSVSWKPNPSEKPLYGEVKFSEQNGEGALSFRYVNFPLISNKVI